ncbi:MAG: hypothetical protein KAT00_12410 [Planctomycetes bacterium]|nr:hypothetical protein [Planctomycetota bacterium]
MAQNLMSKSKSALARAAASGQALRRRMTEERREIGAKMTTGAVGAAAPFLHGLIIGSSNYDGYLPGTVDATTGKGIRTDLVVGGACLAVAIAQPRATYSDAALGAGIGLLGASMGALGEQYGAKMGS